MSPAAGKSAAQQFSTSHPQRLELEADRLGTVLAYRAGYDPLAAIPYLVRMDPHRSRAHPSARLRIAEIRAALAAEATPDAEEGVD